MERQALHSLVRWKQSPYRKPLLLQGVRQVGKSWLLKEFGRRYYGNVAYCSFDEHPEYAQFFERSKDPHRILENLMIAESTKIVPNDTLVIFDEIQECPQAIASLKYFCESAPEYHVACAGSLLGLSLAETISFPVGKVDFLQLYPMTFTEFLLASHQDTLVEYLVEYHTFEPIPNAFFHLLEEKLKTYFITGGMPESILHWTDNQDIEAVQTTLSAILTSYDHDFSKHAGIQQFPKISRIWHAIPSQLARENKKFLYSAVKPGARAREYEDALQWLVDAQLVTKVYRSTAPRLPLTAYDELDAFKVYLVDVGLLRRLSFLAPSAFAEGNRLFTEFKGALSENYILQSLSPQCETTPRYWARNNPPQEVDFLIQKENDVFPIEVKAGTAIKKNSLGTYQKQYRDQTKLRIRYSLRNLDLSGNLLNIPFCMADQTDRLISLALKQTPTTNHSR